MFKICLYSFGVLMLFKSCHRAEQHSEGIQWSTQLDSALVVAQIAEKPVMIDFMATWCPPCQKMEDSTFSQDAVIEKSKAFVPVRIDVDLQGDLANVYQGNARKYGGVGIPNILFLSPQGERMHQVIGYQKPEELIAVMDSIVNRVEHPVEMKLPAVSGRGI